MNEIQSVPLGFEVGTGKQVDIEVRHMCVTGQTNISGKTTALEALISRSGLRAIAFLTKRGEGSFSIGRRLLPFFADSADWRFVESIIEASLKEKNKFQRAWIQKAARGCKTLADVHKNSIKLMKKSTRAMDEDQYMLLNSYFEIVVPQIDKLPKSSTLTIGSGLNVMDLTAYSIEMQMLIVRSVIDWIHKHEKGVITIIPEAWKMIPEGRGSPVKAAAENLIREGAFLRNFVLLDSQDIAGVSKIMLRACSVWIVGVQREANEIKRTLANIPSGIKQPKATDIARLTIGQFYACYGNEIHKVYIWPNWMTADQARDVATGKIKPFGPPTPPPATFVLAAQARQGDRQRLASFPQTQLPATFGQLTTDRHEPRIPATPPFNSSETDMEQALFKQMMDQQRVTNDLLAKLTGGSSATAQAPMADLPWTPDRRADVPPFDPAFDPQVQPADSSEEGLYQRFKARLVKDIPNLIKILESVPEINVEVERTVIEANGSKPAGRIYKLVGEKFFEGDGPAKTLSDLRKELMRTGAEVDNFTLTRNLSELVVWGFLTREGEKGFRGVKGMRVNVKTKKED